MKTTLLAIAISALVLAGCGGGDEKTDNSPEGQAKATILNWTFKKDKCPYMTDKFLETQAFFGDTRAERCAYLLKTYSPVRYSKDDVKFRKVTVNGNTASVVVGSDIANITTTYKLVKTGDGWQIDEAD
jgi:hypothetical protein